MVVLTAALLTVDLRAGHADGGPQVFAKEEVVMGRAGEAALLWVAVVRPAAQLCTRRAVPRAR